MIAETSPPAPIVRSERLMPRRSGKYPEPIPAGAMSPIALISYRPVKPSFKRSAASISLPFFDLKSLQTSCILSKTVQNRAQNQKDAAHRFMDFVSQPMNLICERIPRLSNAQYSMKQILINTFSALLAQSEVGLFRTSRSFCSSLTLLSSLKSLRASLMPVKRPLKRAYRSLLDRSAASNLMIRLAYCIALHSLSLASVLFTQLIVLFIQQMMSSAHYLHQAILHPSNHMYIRTCSAIGIELLVSHAGVTHDSLLGLEVDVQVLGDGVNAHPAWLLGQCYCVQHLLLVNQLPFDLVSHQLLLLRESQVKDVFLGVVLQAAWLVLTLKTVLESSFVVPFSDPLVLLIQEKEMPLSAAGCVRAVHAAVHIVATCYLALVFGLKVVNIDPSEIEFRDNNFPSFSRGKTLDQCIIKGSDMQIGTCGGVQAVQLLILKEKAVTVRGPAHSLNFERYQFNTAFIQEVYLQQFVSTGQQIAARGVHFEQPEVFDSFEHLHMLGQDHHVRQIDHIDLDFLESRTSKSCRQRVQRLVFQHLRDFRDFLLFGRKIELQHLLSEQPCNLIKDRVETAFELFKIFLHGMILKQVVQLESLLHTFDLHNIVSMI